MNAALIREMAAVVRAEIPSYRHYVLANLKQLEVLALGENDTRDTEPAPPLGEEFQWPITCPCEKCAGKAWGPDEWVTLPDGGVQSDGEDGFLSLRHLPCGSTRAVPLIEDREKASRRD